MSEASRTPETDKLEVTHMKYDGLIISEVRTAYSEALAKCRSLETQRDAALEREQRLREALEEVVLCHGSSMPTKEFERRGGDWWAIRNTSIEKARAALAAKGER